MMMKQQALTDKALFDYFMVGSTRENEVYTPFPFYLDETIFNAMVNATRVLDQLVNRIIRKMFQEKNSFELQMDQFPLSDEIFTMNSSIPPFYWTRYDAFQRVDGGIFFSEFNYDKPCAQREIAIADMLNPINNPNSNFIEKFREGFAQLWKEYNQERKDPTVAILVDPGHYEEVHLAQFYMEVLQPLGYEIMIVGGKNISIENEKVIAFQKEIDIILRQFPTEFLDEIDGFDEILKLYEAGKVLILNDPRAIMGQAKSLFATLWQLVEANDPFLTPEEIAVIRSTLPYTKVFSRDMLGELMENKDKYVVKASFGRYSEEVYIGIMHTNEEWEEILKYVENSEKLHIVQEFCPIKKDRTLRFNENLYEEQNAFGNFGIYLVNGEYAGTSLRFSSDYLSSEDKVWISAVGIRKRSFKVQDLVSDDRSRKWIEINDEAAFQYGFTGGYQGAQEAFSLQGLILERNLFEELKTATLCIAEIFKKTTLYVRENNAIINPLLGIREPLMELTTQNFTDFLTFIGRFDWVLDTQGNLKLLEFNSETPAGLVESIFLNEHIWKKLNVKAANPNCEMSQCIQKCFLEIVSQIEKHKKIKNIGIVSSSFGEDWYNTSVIYELIKGLPYELSMGEISGLHARHDKLHLYDVPLDAIYRYYPLDWFDKDECYQGVTKAMKKGTFSINSPSTLVSQSKAFLALVYELKGRGFFSNEEAESIARYIPRTALSPKKAFEGVFCAKPCFGREGDGITFSFKEPFPDPGREDYVYQEWVDIQSVLLNIHAAGKVYEEIAYPVIGTYLIGESFGGIYTRAGSSVTNKWALYLPTYIENRS